MNCNGNCNQGRLCKCAPPAKFGRVWRLIFLLFAAVVLTASVMVIDERLPGAGKIAAAVVAGVVAVTLAAFVLSWIGDRVIDAINWMTRYE